MVESLKSDPAEEEGGEDRRPDQAPRDEASRTIRQHSGHKAFFRPGAEDAQSEQPKTGNGMKSHARIGIKRHENLRIDCLLYTSRCV